MTTAAAVNRARGARQWSRVDLPALLAVTIIGGILRLWNVSDPHSIIFDETYYAKDACWYAEASKSICGIGGEQNYIHPPLGKWLIAGGIRLFGYDSFGWRVAAVVAGTATIALLYLLARRLLKSTLGATIASGLLAFDFLHFVQSRVAMLDVFVTMFGTAAFLFVVYDRDRSLAREGPASTRFRDRLVWRPWRIAAGIAAGAAAASKWSGLFVVVAVVVITIIWEAVRRAGEEAAPIRRTIFQEGPSIGLWLIAAPIVLYALTYVGRFEASLFEWPWSDGAWVRELWDRQFSMWASHRSIREVHPYQSPPWSWLLLKRPVSYFFKTAPDGDYQEILATGNPFAWWLSIPALLYVAFRLVRRPRLAGPEALIIAGFVFSYVPWFFLTGDRSAVFIFYLLPALPFMFLALAYVATRITEWWEGKAAIAIFSVTTIGLFVFYYPLMTKGQLSRESWSTRLWIFDEQCGTDGETVTKSTETEIKDGNTIIRTKSAEREENPPPEGWCWI